MWQWDKYSSSLNVASLSLIVASLLPLVDEKEAELSPVMLHAPSAATESIDAARVPIATRRVAIAKLGFLDGAFIVLWIMFLFIYGGSWIPHGFILVCHVSSARRSGLGVSFLPPAPT